jgi:filamentous hemagglutinin family protein
LSAEFVVKFVERVLWLGVCAVMSSGKASAVPPALNQLPTGAQVTAGQVAIQNKGNITTVQQGSAKAVVNWNSFDLGANATVNFVQPDASAVILNRVNSNQPSQIYGQMNANGQVYLVNPAGVYFAPGASVNVGGLVATTHQMSDTDFLAGKTSFSRQGASGAIINEGTLQARLGGSLNTTGTGVNTLATAGSSAGRSSSPNGRVATTPASTNKLLLIDVVPVAAPISIAVAAPPRLSEVTPELTRLNVAADDVMSPPSTARSPAMLSVSVVLL